MNRRGFLKGCALGVAGIAMPSSAYCTSGRWHERMSPAMGTFVSVAVYSDDARIANAAIDSCVSEMRRVEALITDWNDASETSLINAKRLVHLAELSSELVSLAVSAQLVRGQSSGSFNPLTRELTLRWREAREGGRLPSKLMIDDAIERSHESSIEIDEGRLRLRGRAELEFGGIGKGFVVDAGIRSLRAAGIEFARVAGSGDLRFLGDGPWSVEIEDPRQERTMGSIEVRGEVGVATSGDYRSVTEIGGERFHHLIDLATGQPSRWNRSVTVVAPSALLADAYSTAAFSMPTEQALAFLGRLPGVEGLLVDVHGKVRRTERLRFRESARI